MMDGTAYLSPVMSMSVAKPAKRSRRSSDSFDEFDLLEKRQVKFDRLISTTVMIIFTVTFSWKESSTSLKDFLKTRNL